MVIVRIPPILAAFATVGLVLAPSKGALAVTRDSPEVLAVVDKGLAYLETNNHTELGGKCLVALAFYKRGLRDHPRVKEAIAACRDQMQEVRGNSYDYSKCLAIIFLSELEDGSHTGLISEYLAMLEEHQKDHGGFGYLASPTGDTSQTQYAALAYWHMLHTDISPDANSVQKCLGWLMRTRDPSGVWGYQGVDPGRFDLVPQTSKPGVSMAAAGMSGTMLLGHALGLLKANEQPQVAEAHSTDLPSALRRQEEEKQRRRQRTLPAGDVDPKRVSETLRAGKAWYDKNFTFKVDEYQSYYMYSIERYMSFQEYLSGSAEEEPTWYTDGYHFLKKTQQPDGSWSDASTAPCATAFSVLFLLRSTQQSIQASLGQGTLVGGRGLPRDLSRLRLRGGRLVVEQRPTEVDDLLGLLDNAESGALDELLDNPAAMHVQEVSADEARRLQQVVKSGPPGARMLAVRALSKMRNLDHAPTLIFALTDPDKRVVREARDGLRSISRNFEGFGPPENFDEGDRKAAIEKWKAWYRAVRPDAPPLP
jgi:hypothetical protein